MKRFWDKVEKTDTCWNWTAGSRGNGYGCFKFEGKTIDAHRFVWFLTHGRWSEQWILHSCDNRKCVNPKHLFEGSPRDNFEDAVKKGRATYVIPPKKGDKSFRRKLSKNQIIDIRKKYLTGNFSYRKLAIEYNVCYTNIGKMIRQESYIEIK